jgi:hypothetical protein
MVFDFLEVEKLEPAVYLILADLSDELMGVINFHPNEFKKWGLEVFPEGFNDYFKNY